MKAIIFTVLSFGFALPASANFCSSQTTADVKEVLDKTPMRVLKLGKREFGIFSKTNKALVKKTCDQMIGEHRFFTGRVIRTIICGEIAWTCQTRSVRRFEGGERDEEVTVGDMDPSVGAPDTPDVDPGTDAPDADPETPDQGGGGLGPF